MTQASDFQRSDSRERRVDVSTDNTKQRTRAMNMRVPNGSETFNRINLTRFIGTQRWQGRRVSEKPSHARFTPCQSGAVHRQPNSLSRLG
jgi:hypothetical protein